MTYKDTYRGPWICPQCGFVYQSPLPIRAAFHDCPERDNQRRWLRPSENAEKVPA